MVVWLFSGGGQTELQGLIHFLEANYSFHRFERKTPARIKPGPKPNRLPTQRNLGHTGTALAEQIREVLPVSCRFGRCDLLLIIDDLDCHDPEHRRTLFEEVVQNVPEANGIQRIIGFAAPEIEAWLIADWNHTFATDYQLRTFHQALQYRLRQNGISFITPENFSQYDDDRDACVMKLSEILAIEVFECSGIRYSKADHSSRMLQHAQANVIDQKCPEFRVIHNGLNHE